MSYDCTYDCTCDCDDCDRGDCDCVGDVGFGMNDGVTVGTKLPTPLLIISWIGLPRLNHPTGATEEDKEEEEDVDDVDDDDDDDDDDDKLVVVSLFVACRCRRSIV